MNRPHRRDCAHGFTLVELLVVIGIIGVLIAILLPVTSRIRRAAQTAATKNRLAQIGSAIESYHHDFQAYPGAVPDRYFGAAPPLFISNLSVPVTGTESLVLSLLGGIDADFSTSPPTLRFAVDAQKNPVKPFDALGSGPVSLNPRSPGQKAAYMPVRKDELTSGYCKDEPALSYITGDSQVPEFIDAYADPEYRPILYMRANPGAIAGATKDDNTKIVSDEYESHTSYNLHCVRAYLKTADVLARGAADTDVIKYFSSYSDLSTARGAGSFLLISAGPDHIYGNDDDIIQSGGGGQ
jgi:prepilin-type N-terminal cleavage/methylation domain-containing protein